MAGASQLQASGTPWGFEAPSRPKFQSISALLGALLLHAAFTFVPAQKLSEPSSPAEEWLQIETVPIAAPELAPEPAEEEPKETERVAQPLDQVAQVRNGPSQAGPVGSQENHSESESAAGDSEIGDDAEEAAPVLASDFADANSGFLMASGNGSSLTGGRTAGGRRGAAGVTIARKDLSRPAIAPDLSEHIFRNYPSTARMNHAEGRATVSVTIQADGTPTDIRVRSVNGPSYGFGETCSRTVHQGPKWKPALNQDGRPYASEVRFTCEFALPDDESDAAESGSYSASRVWKAPAGR